MSRPGVWTGSDGHANDELAERLAEAVAARVAAFAQSGRRPGVPLLALSPSDAAAALGVSRDYFDEHVKPELRLIRRGRLVLIAVRELERWLDGAAELTLPSRTAAPEARRQKRGVKRHLAETSRAPAAGRGARGA